MQNLFGEDLEELKKQEEAEEKAKKAAELEKKKLEAEQQKALKEQLKKEKEEKISYSFTTIGDVKANILNALEVMAQDDPQFASKFKKEKMDICYNWLIEQIKNAYTKANGSKNGGIDISNEQCFMACKHFFNEELWKYFDEPKEEKKANSKPKEKQPEQLSFDFDFGTNEEEHQEEDYSQFENGDDFEDEED